MSSAVDPFLAPAIGLLTGAIGGLLVPVLLRRLPEPADGPQGPTYLELAGRGQWTWSAVGGLAGTIVGAAASDLAVLVAWVPVLVVAPTLVVTDTARRLLPKRLVWILLCAVLLGASVVTGVGGDYGRLGRGALGLCCAVGLFLVLWWVSRGRGLGFGDVRLAGPIGFVLAWSSWATWVAGMYAGFIVFALIQVAVHVLTRQRSEGRSELWSRTGAYGPAMLLGALIGLVL